MYALLVIITHLLSLTTVQLVGRQYIEPDAQSVLNAVQRRNGAQTWIQILWQGGQEV